MSVPAVTDSDISRDCPDQTDSSNHVTLWDGSNYKRALAAIAFSPGRVCPNPALATRR